MSRTIRVSKQYGLNPSVEKCIVCGKEMGLVLFGTSYKGADGKTAEAPREIYTGNLCDDCRKVIDNGGVFIIEVLDGETGSHPYRTGRLVGIKREAAERLFKEVHPIAYMEKTSFEHLFGDYCKENT